MVFTRFSGRTWLTHWLTD